MLLTVQALKTSELISRPTFGATCLVAISICFVCLISARGFAQEAEQQVQDLPADVATRLDELQSQILAEEEEVQRLTAQIAGLDSDAAADQLLADVLSARRDRSGTDQFRNTLDLAREVAARREAGFDVSAYESSVVDDLNQIPDATRGALNRGRLRVVFPDQGLPPEDVVYLDQRLFALLAELDEIYQVLIDFIELAPRFGIDASAERTYLETELVDSAENRSVFLHLALDDVAALRASVATLPDNAGLDARYAAMQRRVQNTASLMQTTVNQMNAVGIETRAYRRQVLSVTGEITTDVLDVGIVSTLVQEWSAAILDIAAKEGPKWILRLILVSTIIFVFFHIAKLSQKLVIRGLNSAKVTFSYLLKEMITSAVRNLIILLGVLIAISQLGISLGPLLAGLGIAGFIIGFALQDSLANFASGMLILLYRPFDVGDVVEAGGVSGRVSAMSLVNTTFLTLDNQKMIVPNNMIWGSVITNVTAQRKRRIDMVVGISYNDDIEKAQNVLEGILAEHEEVLDDPAAMVRLHEFGDSSVNFIVRPWVNTADYWETFWALNKEVKLRFDAEGISIPFPQRDVHLVEQSPA